jgi:hypothetical protein
LIAALIIGIAIGALCEIRRADLAPAIWFDTFSASFATRIYGTS